MCLINKAGLILDANSKFLSLTGFSNIEINDLFFISLFKKMPDVFFKEMGAEAPLSGIHFDAELQLTNRKQSWVEVAVTCVNEKKSFYLVFLWDLTARIEAEQELSYRNSSLDFLTHYASELAAENKPDESLIQFISSKLKEFTGAEFVFYSNYNPANRTLQLTEIKAELEFQTAMRDKFKIRNGGVVIPVSAEKLIFMLKNTIQFFSSIEDVIRGDFQNDSAANFFHQRGIRQYVTLAYVVGGRLLAASLLGFTENQKIPRREFLLSFSFLSAVSLMRNKIEKDLYRSRERFRTMIDSITDSIFVLDKNGVIEAANKSSSRFMNIPFQDLIGAGFYEITRYSSDRYALPVLREVFATGESQVLDHEYQNRYYRASFFPIFGEKKNVISALVQIEDSTERKEIQERLHQAEKMKSIGELAGGVAHDFNNQLSGILGYTELILSKSNDPQFRRYLEKIYKSADNAAVLTKQLLNYAKKGYKEDLPVDIHRLLNELEDHTPQKKTRRILTKMTLLAERHWVMGDANLLHNVFLNLYLNAEDAMSDGGTLRIETKNKTLTKKEKDCIEGFDCTNCLSIVFADEGGGISRENLRRIFDPFFTTKNEGEGTGMGLASAYGTVESHGGCIFARSEVGKGSVFTLYFPVADPPASELNG